MAQDASAAAISHNQAFGEEPGEVQTSPLLPRLAWMVCYAETGSSQAVCEKFGVSKKTFYKWLKRYQNANGSPMSLLDHSRRPHRSPNATPRETVQLLLEARQETGFGQRRLKSYLEQKHQIVLSERTIWKLLKNCDWIPGSSLK